MITVYPELGDFVNSALSITFSLGCDFSEFVSHWNNKIHHQNALKNVFHISILTCWKLRSENVTKVRSQ